MKLSVSPSLLLAAAVALASGGTAFAAPFVTVEVLGSTTQGGTYSSSLSSIAPGTTIYYEVELISAPTGTTNLNKAGTSPDGTTDSFNSIPTFILTGTSGTFVSSTEPTNVKGGSGATAGTTGSSTLSVRAIASPGVFLNDDTAVLLDSGTFTTGASTTAITAAFSTGSSGSLRVGGTTVLATNTTETGANPYVGYSALSITAPVTGPTAPVVSLSQTAPTDGATNLGTIDLTSNPSVLGVTTPAGTTEGYITVTDYKTPGDFKILLDLTGSNLAAEQAYIAANTTAVVSSGNEGVTGFNFNTVLDFGTTVPAGTNYFEIALPAGDTIGAIGAIPEPASLSLLAVGAMGILARRRK